MRRSGSWSVGTDLTVLGTPVSGYALAQSSLAATKRTTDINIVLDGEMVLAIDGGKDGALAPGDCVVIAGARPAGQNDRALPARVAFLTAGPRRNDVHDQ